MTISFLRTIGLYLFIVAVVRIMGKRQVGELEPAELVVTIMISELASIPMQEPGVPLISGAVPILTLVILEVFFSYIEMKSKKLRRIMSGKPSILVHEGKILFNEMKKIRFNRDDLMEELRLAGCANIGDVQYAILETNGQMSVILKKDKSPATIKDINKIKGGKGKKK
ncbi:MAG: hypothetical protein BWY15_01072 [Firmicutes bacterium ADurb.Bin193]|nr:MAG: hypothetical protein BWY15_01072 [Firmicutes bacterium ADurb.Bin193]